MVATLAINTQQWIVIIETSLGGKYRYNNRKWSIFRFRVSIKTGSSEQSKTFSKEIDRDLGKKTSELLEGHDNASDQVFSHSRFLAFPASFPAVLTWSSNWLMMMSTFIPIGCWDYLVFRLSKLKCKQLQC